jgi:hypothetical protein
MLGSEHLSRYPPIRVAALEQEVKLSGPRNCGP